MVVGFPSRDSSLSLFCLVKTRPSHGTEGLGMTIDRGLKDSAQSRDPQRVVGIHARESSLSLFTLVKTRPRHGTEL
jgi:hypothetical protein